MSYLRIALRMIALALVAFLVGCQSQPKEATPAPVTQETLRFLTEPAGGVVQVNGHTLNHGEELTLHRGRFRAKATLDGYEEGAIDLRVLPEAKQPEPREVIVPLGAPYGRLEFELEPTDAQVFIRGRVAQSGELLLLPAGEYDFVVSRRGYFEREGELVLEAGQEARRSVRLEAIPTAATLRITTAHADTQLFSNGQLLGEGAVELDALPFGRYEIQAVRTLNSWQRQRGLLRLAHDGTQAQATVRLTQDEWFFDGEWRPAAQARAAEQARYERQRVAYPVVFQLTDADALVASQAEFENTEFQNKEHRNLAAWLHAHLLVGDQLHWQRGQTQGVIWKRSEQFTAEFAEAVQAMVANQSYLDVWQNAAAAAPYVDGSGSVESFAALILDLHRHRHNAPMLDLSASQLSQNSISIARQPSDGDLWLMAQVAAETGLTLDDMERMGDDRGLVFQRISAGTEVVNVSWSSTPKRLLVMAERPLTVATAFDQPPVLLVGEKQLVPLVEQNTVERWLSLTSQPTEARWLRDSMSSEGLAGIRLDISHADVGPHEAAGDYKRIWLVEIRSGEGVTQRQVSHRYHVRDERLQTESDMFIRRRAPDVDR